MFISFEELSQETPPTTEQLGNRYAVMWYKSDTDETYLCYNHDGEIRKVELL